MKPSIQSESYAVFDDVLPKRQLERVRRYVTTEVGLEYVNRSEYEPVWTLDDGHPLQSPTVIAEIEKVPGARRQYRARSDAKLSGPLYYSYPSDCGIDIVVSMLIGELGTLERWIGRPGREWRSMTARVFVYPQGTGLGWHDDRESCVGAYTFYAHEVWRPQWGGELLIDGGDDAGAYVLPRPNRLVIVRGGTAHKIARVSTLAGESFRRSISGFFDVRGRRPAMGLEEQRE